MHILLAIKFTVGQLSLGHDGSVHAPDTVHHVAEAVAVAAPAPKKRRESRILKAAKRELELERAAAAQAAPSGRAGSQSGAEERHNQSAASNGIAQQPKQALGKAGKKKIAQKFEGASTLPATGKAALQKQSAGKAGALKKIKKQKAKG